MEQTCPPHPLKQWRNDAGLTLDAAAAKVGTTRPVWWSWENGKKIPSPPFMAGIMDVTEGKVSADHFFHNLRKAA